MKNYIIEHNIPKTREGTYYTIDFPIPEGCESVTVAYSYKRITGKSRALHKNRNVVDLGLMDADGRFIGWSGSARSSVFVGPYASTQGYSMVPLKAGIWKIIIGAYKIPDEGLDVNYEISYAETGPRWLVGDLHMHSNASDGQHDIFTLTKMAIKRKLDFIAVSNHNNYSENMHLPVVPGLTLIPAVEWTHYLGHMNFFGVKSPFDNSFVANNEEEMLTLISNAKSMGALISVNHPKCRICPYLWKSTNCFDMVEVWNGPMRKVNMNGIKWWHEMLVSGRKIPLVGGSDYHKSCHVVRMGHPVTYLYTDSPSEKDILSALSKGNSYITSKVSGIKLELICGETIMGDTISHESGQVLSVLAHNVKCGMRLKLITNEGVSASWKTFKKGELKEQVQISKNWTFAYLIAERSFMGIKRVCAITNPIYFV